MVPPDDLTKLFLRFIAKREFLSSTNRGAAFLSRSESCATIFAAPRAMNLLCHREPDQ